MSKIIPINRQVSYDDHKGRIPHDAVFTKSPNPPQIITSQCIIPHYPELFRSAAACATTQGFAGGVVLADFWVKGGFQFYIVICTDSHIEYSKDSIFVTFHQLSASFIVFHQGLLIFIKKIYLPSSYSHTIVNREVLKTFRVR
jgi:hypothetical protein